MTEITGVSRYFRYQQDLLKSGWYAILNKAESARLNILVACMKGEDYSTYPGKRRTERCVGLTRKYTDRVDYKLGKVGLIGKRETIKLGKITTYKYYMNPEVPPADIRKLKKARARVVALLGNHKGNHEVVAFLRKVVAFWKTSGCLFDDRWLPSKAKLGNTILNTSINNTKQSIVSQKGTSKEKTKEDTKQEFRKAFNRLSKADKADYKMYKNKLKDDKQQCLIPGYIDLIRLGRAPYEAFDEVMKKSSQNKTREYTGHD